MSINTILTENHFPKEAIEILMNAGIKDFFPPQKQAIEAGILKGNNVLLSIPTAAGKTLIAELMMIQHILKRQGRCLYIVPLKALGSEKYEDFKTKYESLGISVGLATGDFDTSEKSLSRHQIVIATAEKVDSLLRGRAKWLIDNLTAVIIDEIHFINDDSRGPVLEILIARIRQLNPQIQLLGLSATVKNAKEMAQWLNAQLVLSDWRPIPLKEGVFYNHEIIFHKHAAKIIKEEPPDDISKLSVDTVRGKGQVLIFVNSRKSAQAASREITPSIGRLVTPEEKPLLQKLSEKVLGSPSESTKVCRKLADAVRHGVAFHHAGLRPEQRELIEHNFKNGLIKAICSTPTLAAGVNLPARRAIIRDVKRFESGLGSAYIPVSEYKQCAGRAGRPKYDDYGEAVLIAKTSGEMKTLFDKYIKAESEPIFSKLGNQNALRFHILASIAGGYVHDMNDTFEFLSHTFLSHQRLIPNLLDVVGDVFEFLSQEGFIEKSGFRFNATPFGQCTSRLYIDPATSIILRDGLKKIHQGKSFSAIGLLHLMSCCPDNPLLKPGKNDAEDIEFFINKCGDELIISEEEVPMLGDFLMYLSVAKTTMLLTDWIEEEKEEAMCDKFGIGPGDIYRHIEAVRWLLNAAISFAELFAMPQLTWPIAHLKNRVQYGVKEELTELTQLKGVGRVRARSLFENGFKTFKDLKAAKLDDIAQIDKIGKTLANDILAQLAKPTPTSIILDGHLSKLLKNFSS